MTGGTHAYCAQDQPARGGGGKGGGGRAEAPRQPAAPGSRVSVCSRMTGDEGSRGYGGNGGGWRGEGGMDMVEGGMEVEGRGGQRLRAI